MKQTLLNTLTVLSFLAFVPGAQAATCLYVDSYHEGYAWSDALRKAFAETIGDACEVKTFLMDSKRNTDPAFIKVKAKEVYNLIQKIKPDVVVAADDNASKFLVTSYLKDTETPVVFAGINWTAEAYGYPYSNATGMIEVDPFEQILDNIAEFDETAKRVGFLTVDRFSARKEMGYLQKFAEERGLTFVPIFAQSMAEWEAGLKNDDAYDVLIIGNNAGMADWDEAKARGMSVKYLKKFSVTYMNWMMPYTLYGMTKVPAEQGEWSAEITKQLLQGVSPEEIPIVPNRRWKSYVNPDLQESSGIELPRSFVVRAVIYGEDE